MLQGPGWMDRLNLATGGKCFYTKPMNSALKKDQFVEDMRCISSLCIGVQSGFPVAKVARAHAPLSREGKPDQPYSCTFSY